MARYPQSDKSALSPAEILADPTASFGGLLERAALLMRLEELLRTLLEPALAERFHVANLRQHRLILLAPSATWATRLRMQGPQLIEALKHSGFADIEAIDVRVAPLTTETPAAPSAKPLSSAAREALDLMARLGGESEG
jgi:hypothetical protein